MEDYQFKWIWCDTCNCAAVLCPKCLNNSCNGTYGPADGTIYDPDYNPCASSKCSVCPLAYQYQNLAYSTKQVPNKEEVDHERQD